MSALDRGTHEATLPITPAFRDCLEHNRVLGDSAMGKEAVKIMRETGAAVLYDFRGLRLLREGEDNVLN